jgi:hypothetical protein
VTSAMVCAGPLNPCRPCHLPSLPPPRSQFPTPRLLSRRCRRRPNTVMAVPTPPFVHHPCSPPCHHHCHLKVHGRDLGIHVPRPLATSTPSTTPPLHVSQVMLTPGPPQYPFQVISILGTLLTITIHIQVIHMIIRCSRLVVVMTKINSVSTFLT